MAPEPWVLSLIKYRKGNDVRPVQDGEDPQLVSSRWSDGMQRPILDLDFDHDYLPSTSPGHGHLYLNVPIGQWRWRALQLVLWWCKVQEPGYSVWSLRRGANFVRLPGVEKKPPEANVTVFYGWLRRRREAQGH